MPGFKTTIDPVAGDVLVRGSITTQDVIAAQQALSVCLGTAP
jgi:hypothetical protein